MAKSQGSKLQRARKTDDGPFDCSEFACKIREIRFVDPELTKLDGDAELLRHTEDLKDGVLKNAEAALRAKARTYRIYQTVEGCPGGCYCKVSAKEKNKKGGWKDEGEEEIAAPYTFPGAKEQHEATGLADKQSRILQGTCRRNEIMLPA